MRNRHVKMANMENDDIESLFGDVIYSYTRKQAVEDGEQVDITESDCYKESGFNYPVYLSRRVWDVCVEVPDNKPAQDLNGRLWDICWMYKMAARRVSERTDRMNFQVKVVTEKGSRIQNLIAIVGPKDIDDASPAITICYPDED